MDPEQTATTTTTVPAEVSTTALGAAGEKALDAFKQRAREAERTLRDERAAREAAESELIRLREAGRSETEKAIEKARREAADAACKEESERAALRVGELMAQRLRDRVALAATGRFVDPDVAARLLDTDELVTDDGSPDEAAIASALDGLLERSPYLALPGHAPKPPPPDPDAGPRGGGQGDLDRRVRDRARRMGARVDD